MENGQGIVEENSRGRLVWTPVEESGEDAPEVSILVAGDLCVRGRTEEPVLQGQASHVVAGLESSFSGTDLSIVNLEGPVATCGAPIPKSGPNIRMVPEAIHVALAAGFEVACCANNHIGDYGPDAVLETMRRLEQAGIRPVGAGSDIEEARAALVLRRRGLSIGILGFAENEFGLADRETAGGNRLDPINNLRDIEKTAAEVDIVVVLVHGGNEYNPVPSPRMKRTYRAFADAGADAVIGGHTHCPQGMEVWGGVPIVYSLGNFLFDVRPRKGPFKPPAWWTGYSVRISLTRTGARGLEIIPHSCFPDARAVAPLQDREKTRFLAYIDYLSQVLRDDAEAERYWDGWCSRQGQGYVERLHRGIDHAEGDPRQTLLEFRNLLSCEAHRELLTGYLELASQGLLEQAREYVPRLNRLMEGAIPDPSCPSP